MRQICATFVCLGCTVLWAQTPEPSAAPAGPPQLIQSKEIALAKIEIDRVAELVKAGALPRVRLDEAEQKLADAQDDAILARTLYGDLPANNLSEQMADEMVAAAQRRVERQMLKIEQARKLLADGVIAQSSLQPLEDELNVRKMNLNLAHSRSKLIGELAAIAKYEQSMQQLQTSAKIEPYTDYTMRSLVHYEGSGTFLANRDLKSLETAFQRRFDRPLPISADGQTAVHDAFGFDHRGRIDVAVNPNEPAGIWLRHYLEAKRVPYYAFLRAIPGKATGAHIHIGPGSTRLHNAD
jgi:hypothetical protein